MFEVGIDADPVRMRFQFAQQAPAQVDQRRGGAGRDVQPPEQFLARRFDGVLQRDQVFRCGVFTIGRGSGGDRCRVG